MTTYCAQHQHLGWDSGLYEEGNITQAQAFVGLCFLIVDATGTIASKLLPLGFLCHNELYPEQ